MESMKCRLCLKNPGVCDIFDTHYPIIISILQNILKIQKNDHLPKAICTTCNVELKNMEKFIKTCLKSDTNLRKKFPEISIKQESENYLNFNPSEIIQQGTVEIKFIRKDAFDECNKETEAPVADLDIKHDSFYNEEDLGTDYLEDNETAIAIGNEINSNANETLDMKLHTCTSCPAVFKSFNRFEKHTQAHETEKIINCNLCRKVYGIKEVIDLHIRNEHKRNDKLTSKLKKNEDLTDVEEGLKICSECGKGFKRTYGLQRHFKMHLKENKINNGVEVAPKSKRKRKKILNWNSRLLHFKCNLCPAAYKSIENLDSHIKMHSESNVCTCYICHKVYSSRHIVVRHLSEVHNVNIKDYSSVALNDLICPGRGSEKHEAKLCPTCGKFCKDQPSLRRHLAIHSTNVYECDDCGKRFKIKRQIMNHMIKHQDVRAFQCQYCPKRYKTRNVRNHHEKACHLEIIPKVTCEICQKTFCSRSILKRHLRIHSDEKNYECGICFRCFRDPNNLLKHELVHSDERPYSCRFCPSMFKTPDYVKEHERLHTGETPFKCPICLRGYAQRCNMKSHFRHNHKELDYKEEWTKYKLRMKQGENV